MAERWTPGLKDVRCTCCSMPLDMELEHTVRQSTPDLYLMCCPVLARGAKFVNKSVNKMGMAYGEPLTFRAMPGIGPNQRDRRSSRRVDKNFESFAAIEP